MSSTSIWHWLILLTPVAIIAWVLIWQFGRTRNRFGDSPLNQETMKGLERRMIIARVRGDQFPLESLIVQHMNAHVLGGLQLNAGHIEDEEPRRKIIAMLSALPPREVTKVGSDHYRVSKTGYYQLLRNVDAARDGAASIVPSTVQRRTASAVRSPLDMIFMSYRREDSHDSSGRIHDRLAAAFGAARIFKDVDSIGPGIDYRTKIQESLERSGTCLVVMGRNWTASLADGTRRIDNPADPVRLEIEMALGRGLHVIPVLVQGAQMLRADALPESIRELAYRNAIPVRPDPDFNRDIEKLIADLRKT